MGGLVRVYVSGILVKCIQENSVSSVISRRQVAVPRRIMKRMTNFSSTHGAIPRFHWCGDPTVVDTWSINGVLADGTNPTEVNARSTNAVLAD